MAKHAVHLAPHHTHARPHKTGTHHKHTPAARPLKHHATHHAKKKH